MELHLTIHALIYSTHSAHPTHTNQAAAYPPPHLQAAGGMLRGARQNFRTSVFHFIALLLEVPRSFAHTNKAIFRTSTAHANFGLPLRLVFPQSFNTSDSSSKIVLRNTSSDGFLKILPNTINCCSNNKSLNFGAFTYESTSALVIRLQ